MLGMTPSTSSPAFPGSCVRASLPDERREPEIRRAIPSRIAGGGRHAGMEAGERLDPDAAVRSRPDQQSAALRLPELRARVGAPGCELANGVLRYSRPRNRQYCEPPFGRAGHKRKEPARVIPMRAR